MHSDAPRDPRDLLDGWRDSGADRADPIRFRFIEALARRASDYRGEAGRLLEERVAGLVADYGEVLARASRAVTPPATPPQRPVALSDLAALKECLGRRASLAGVPTTATPTALAASPAQRAHHSHHAEPELADYFRDTWARVSVDRQLRQSQAGVPENAGPLNTNHLVHRSLSLMREVSPGYLEQFLSYVDALSRLEGMHAISPVPNRETPHAPAPRKTRPKPGKTGSGTA
jgi:hypothetical protein